jgi:hypothetical protein
VDSWGTKTFQCHSLEHVKLSIQKPKVHINFFKQFWNKDKRSWVLLGILSEALFMKKTVQRMSEQLTFRQQTIAYRIALYLDPCTERLDCLRQLGLFHFLQASRIKWRAGSVQTRRRTAAINSNLNPKLLLRGFQNEAIYEAGSNLAPWTRLCIMPSASSSSRDCGSPLRITADEGVFSHLIRLVTVGARVQPRCTFGFTRWRSEFRRTGSQQLPLMFRGHSTRLEGLSNVSMLDRK